MSELIHSVELKSGKTVYFRDIKMGDKDVAIDLAGSKVNDASNSFGFAYHLTKEMIKLTMVGVAQKDEDAKKLSASQKEDLSGLFDEPEFNQIQDWYGKKMVGGPTEAPKHMMVADPFGAQ